jgi:hypothetical protein
MAGVESGAGGVLGWLAVCADRRTVADRITAIITQRIFTTLSVCSSDSLRTEARGIATVLPLPVRGISHSDARRIVLRPALLWNADFLGFNLGSWTANPDAQFVNAEYCDCLRRIFFSSIMRATRNQSRNPTLKSANAPIAICCGLIMFPNAIEHEAA